MDLSKLIWSISTDSVNTKLTRSIWKIAKMAYMYPEIDHWPGGSKALFDLNNNSTYLWTDDQSMDSWLLSVTQYLIVDLMIGQI